MQSSAIETAEPPSHGALCMAFLLSASRLLAETASTIAVPPQSPPREAPVPGGHFAASHRAARFLAKQNPAAARGPEGHCDARSPPVALVDGDTFAALSAHYGSHLLAGTTAARHRHSYALSLGGTPHAAPEDDTPLQRKEKADPGAGRRARAKALREVPDTAALHRALCRRCGVFRDAATAGSGTGCRVCRRSGSIKIPDSSVDGTSRKRLPAQRAKKRAAVPVRDGGGDAMPLVPTLFRKLQQRRKHLSASKKQSPTASGASSPAPSGVAKKTLKVRGVADGLGAGVLVASPVAMAPLPSAALPPTSQTPSRSTPKVRVRDDAVAAVAVTATGRPLKKRRAEPASPVVVVAPNAPAASAAAKKPASRSTSKAKSPATMSGKKAAVVPSGAPAASATTDFMADMRAMGIF
jgi:hypothetical protein